MPCSYKNRTCVVFHASVNRASLVHTDAHTTIIIIIIIIHTFLSRHKLVTSETFIIVMNYVASLFS